MVMASTLVLINTVYNFSVGDEWVEELITIIIIVSFGLYYFFWNYSDLPFIVSFPELLIILFNRILSYYMFSSYHKPRV